MPESPYGLVDAAKVHAAIEELRRRGPGARDIARAAGVPTDTVDRAIAGYGSIRCGAAAAIRAAAANDELVS